MPDMLRLSPEESQREKSDSGETASGQHRSCHSVAAALAIIYTAIGGISGGRFFVNAQKNRCAQRGKLYRWRGLFSAGENCNKIRVILLQLDYVARKLMKRVKKMYDYTIVFVAVLLYNADIG